MKFIARPANPGGTKQAGRPWQNAEHRQSRQARLNSAKSRGPRIRYHWHDVRIPTRPLA